MIQHYTGMQKKKKKKKKKNKKKYNKEYTMPYYNIILHDTTHTTQSIVTQHNTQQHSIT